MENVPSGLAQETLLAGLHDMASGQVELKHFFVTAQRRPSEIWLLAQQLGFEALTQILGARCSKNRSAQQRFILRITAFNCFFLDLPEADSIAAVVEKIKQHLPEGYGVETSRNLPNVAVGLSAAEFSFELEVDGNLILQGPLKDQRAQKAVKALAQARFGFDKVAFLDRWFR